MNLDDVRIFGQVVSSGSFTAAARVLGLPKSTVSRRVADLEADLGVSLLNRTTRTLRLTEAGEVYFTRTGPALEELREAVHAVEELQSEPRGLLRITVPGDLNGALPGLIRDFQERYPRVELVVFATNRRVDLVSEGYDLALRAGQLDDSSLKSRRILGSTLRVFASPEYLERAGWPQQPQDLCHHECLIFSNEETRAVWRLVGPEGEVRVPVRGRLASGDFNLLHAAATLVRAVRPQLSHVLPDYRNDEGGLFAVYPQGKYLAPKVRAFIDFSVAWIQENIGQAVRACSQAGQSCPNG